MDLALVDSASEQFLGQWKRLVSTTNWEKGRIIHQWRQTLTEQDAPAYEYSDDTWSQRVGNVTPQHIGRLRRVYERFATTKDNYPGVYWSHFQAALDWHDAEMWLEGAVQNGWSIAEMRHSRWEATGALAADRANDEAASIEPWDDDAESQDSTDIVNATMAEVHTPQRAAADDDLGEADDEDAFNHNQFDGDDGGNRDGAAQERAEIFRPFADLPPLPADVSDAFEAYKLCILRHKLAGWREISQGDMLASLEALKELSLAPADA